MRTTAEGRDQSHTAVREVMTPGIRYCYEDQPVDEAAKLMSRQQIRRLPVLNRQKRLVGIVSLGDLAVETHDKALAGEGLAPIVLQCVPCLSC